MKVKLTINCVNCGEEISRISEHLTDTIPEVHLMEFEQSDWECDSCSHITVTGDFESIYDSENI